MDPLTILCGLWNVPYRRRPRFAGGLLALAALLLLPFTVRAEEAYQFPKGVPVKGSDVTFYSPTDHYQMTSETGYGGVHDRRYNISAAKPREKFGNANLEFPWKTGGMDDSSNGTSFKFHRFPKDAKIEYWQDRGWNKHEHIGGINYLLRLAPGQTRWRYPDGTIFGEVLQVDGRTFEVRVMEKVKGKWEFRTYRPWEKKGELPKDMRLGPIDKKTERLRNRHPLTVFDETAAVAETDSGEAGVLAVLARPFRNVTNAGFCPTATKKGQVVPVNYKGAFLTKNTCVKCHDTAGKSSREFEPSRDWYGTVRGSDGVFSFSIFDDSCASPNGITRRVVLRNDIPLVARKEE